MCHKSLISCSAFLNFIACTSESAFVITVGEKAELKSPGYPYDVPVDISCRWLLEALDGQVNKGEYY